MASRNDITRAKAAATRLFGNSYTVATTLAPQGQNGFCVNILLERGTERFLLKCISKSKVDAGRDIATTLDEVRSGMTVQSDIFVTLLQVEEDTEFVYLLFPFINGVNLRDYIETNGLLSEADTVRVLQQLLEGVAHLSQHGITHQDIKPENILVMDGLRIKLLDFGSSRFKKHSYRGRTNTNRLYSSPEQILASRPGNLEMLRLTCDEKSDVYAVGLIGYWLLEGRNAFDNNDTKISDHAFTPITRADVSDSLKNIIHVILSRHQRHRPKAVDAIGALITGVLTVPLDFRRDFFYTATSGSIKTLINAFKLEPDLFQGVIIGASKIPQTDIDFVRSGPLITIIDPQAYFLQSPTRMNTKFKELPYYILVADENGIVSFDSIRTNLEEFVRLAIEFQLVNGADIICPPFISVVEFNDESWLLNNDIAETTLRLADQIRPDAKVLYGISVAENILTSDVSRGRILDQITSPQWSSRVAGYIVMLESETEVLSNEPWLASSKDFVINLLSAGLPVVWNHAPLPASLLSFRGISIGTGESQSQRCFSISHVDASIRRTSPTFYIPQMYTRINWPAGFETLQRERYRRLNELYCNDSCCSDFNFNNPTTRDQIVLKTHMLIQIAKQYRDNNSADIVRANIETAKAHYASLANDPSEFVRLTLRNEFKQNNPNRLDNWLNAFF